MSLEEYQPRLQDMTYCPACSSARIAVFEKPPYGACLDCKMAWEPIPAGEPYLVDGEPMPFEKPCDTCAFRGGSSERANKDYWESLKIALANGGRFFCHKGVPFPLVNAQGLPELEDRAFQYPRTAEGRYDMDRMRLCRGYLNAHVGPILKKYSLRERK
ncbi:MAG TPA: hypothetical protein VM756_05150 [Burkholderiales bacterium]|nr:hypothetical protein [Burkholderiales bacterium]